MKKANPMSIKGTTLHVDGEGEMVGEVSRLLRIRVLKPDTFGVSNSAALHLPIDYVRHAPIY